MLSFRNLRGLACFLLICLVATKTSNATNTVTITSPSGGGPFGPNAVMTIAGNVGWTWGWDPAPYGVQVLLIGPQNFDYINGPAVQFNASFGSGTWNNGQTQWGNGGGRPSGHYDLIVWSVDYYGKQLSNEATLGLNYAGPGGAGPGPGGGPPVSG